MGEQSAWGPSSCPLCHENSPLLSVRMLDNTIPLLVQSYRHPNDNPHSRSRSMGSFVK